MQRPEAGKNLKEQKVSQWPWCSDEAENSPVTNWVILGKVHNCSESQFPHLLMEIIIMKPFSEGQTKSRISHQHNHWPRLGSQEMSPLVIGDRPSGVMVFAGQVEAFTSFPLPGLPPQIHQFISNWSPALPICLGSLPTIQCLED